MEFSFLKEYFDFSGLQATPVEETSTAIAEEMFETVEKGHQATAVEEPSTSIAEEMFETVESALHIDGDTTSEESSKRKEPSQSQTVVASQDPPEDNPRQQKAEFVIPPELYSMDSYFEDVENQVSDVSQDDETDAHDGDESASHKMLSIKTTFSSLAERFRSLAGRKDPPELQDAPSVESEETGSSNSSGTASTDGSSSEKGDKSAANISQELTEIPLDEDANSQKKSESNQGKSRTRRTPKSQSSTKEEEKHIILFGHGKKWTLIAIVLSWIGFAFAFLSRSSTEYVTLDIPIYIDAVFDTVTEIGLINLRLCYNESFTDQSGCMIHELAADDVDDRMFQISRSLVFMAILFGGFLSTCLSASVWWTSIDLRPIGIGFLITYFFQSFSFLFFDTELCFEHKCHFGRGCYFSAVASVCWLASGIAASRMEATKHKKMRIQRRQRSRTQSPNKNTLKKSQLLEREISNVTAKTEESLEFIDGIQDKEASRAWKARHASQPTSAVKRSHVPSKCTQATSVPSNAPKAERSIPSSSRPRSNRKEEVGLADEVAVKRIKPMGAPTVSKAVHHQSKAPRSTLESEGPTCKLPAVSKSTIVSCPPPSKRRPPSSTPKRSPEASSGTSCRTPSSKERSNHSSLCRTTIPEGERSRSKGRPTSSRAKTSAAPTQSSNQEQRLQTSARSRTRSRPASARTKTSAAPTQSSNQEQRLQTSARSRSRSRPASARTKTSASSLRRSTDPINSFTFYNL
jgi:hypothetical protein